MRKLQFSNFVCFSISPPPAVSAAQKKYERERFRVEPGRIENYTLGRGSLANQEVYKVSYLDNYDEDVY